MLKRSKDRKVANSVTAGGNVNIRNAFGLPAGPKFSCPGATATCFKVCYAGKMERIPTMKGIRDVVNHNFDQLKDADFNQQFILLNEMIAEFEAECERKGAVKRFRIHWDGDFFSLQYAYAWAKVIDNHPDIQFWAYTRSFNVVEAFIESRNLSLYLSTDKDNVKQAVATKKAFPFVNYATLADTFAEARDMVESDKSYDCPELSGRIELITPKGSACNRCGVCVVGRGAVVFSISKR